MRINGYCCLGFVCQIIELESASVRLINQWWTELLFNIYYQQLVDQSKVQHADKRTGTGVSVALSLPQSHCCVWRWLILKHEQISSWYFQMRAEPLWDCPVSVLTVVRVWLCMMVSHCMYIILPHVLEGQILLALAVEYKLQGIKDVSTDWADGIKLNWSRVRVSSIAWDPRTGWLCAGAARQDYAGSCYTVDTELTDWHNIQSYLHLPVHTLLGSWMQFWTKIFDVVAWNIHRTAQVVLGPPVAFRAIKVLR